MKSKGTLFINFVTLEMLEVTGYISELLFLHDCVIIPDFGGFVARHVPSGIDSSGVVLTPPSKSILFNRNLKNNDGLLANALMEKSGFSYTEAIAKINAFAKESENKLTINKRLELENIGILFIDQEKNIQFEPNADINYLLESFGFSAVLARPIIAEAQVNQVVFKDRKLEEKTVSISKRKNIRTAIALSITVPLVALSLFLSFRNDQIRNAVYATFKPIFVREQKVYESKKYSSTNLLFGKEKIQSPAPDANGYGSFKLSENGVSLYVNISDTAFSADKTNVVKNNIKINSNNNNSESSSKYQIVLGCFAIEDNANRLVNTLHSRNISAYISGVNKNGLHVVSAGGYNSVGAAREKLNEIRQNYPNAWLYAN